MTSWGYTLSSEEHSPRDLVRHAVRAEEVGFDFLTISDHFHPWIDAQGHSPFVWSVLGAVAHATSRVRVGTGVTCPIVRTPPALVAHAAATTAVMFEGRFFLGVGAGEALNEHVMGQYWPPIEIRHEMLTEALVVMRELWKGETVDFHGTYFTVENARLYDVPDAPIPVVVSAFGPKAAEVAAKEGDGIWMTGPRDDVLDAFEKAKGHRSAHRAADRLLGAHRGRGRRDRVAALAQHGPAGSARAGPPDSVTLRAGRAARTHGGHRREGALRA